jgi:hypothetical protein
MSKPAILPILVCLTALRSGRITHADDPATDTKPVIINREGVGSAAPLGSELTRPARGRYRYQNGRWWYLTRDNRWFYWMNNEWIAYRVGRIEPGAVESPSFNRRFATYQDYQVGQGRLRTAEGGNAELATDEITEPGEATEAFTMGGVPLREAERPRVGIRRTSEKPAEWFNRGSPFGIRYGYGSGFGYGGYGFNNPYGYGPRTGSGGGFGYGFGPYGSVGGQTGSQGGGAGASLISSEPSSIGSPGQLEKGPVGGSLTRPARRKLGGSASSSGRSD